jgi:hypothetical protein
MNGAWKSPTIWAAGGAAVGVVLAGVLKDQQVVTAANWAELIGIVGAGIAAACAAFVAKLRK